MYLAREGNVYETGPDMRAVFEELITEEFAPNVNLSFEFVDNDDPRESDVRVEFHKRRINKGFPAPTWSYVGDTQFINYKGFEGVDDIETKPTMQIYQVARTSRELLVGVMRLEICHMLGFTDRPKHTESGIPWKDYNELSIETKEIFEFDPEWYFYMQNHLYGSTYYDPTSITYLLNKEIKNNMLFSYHHLSRGDIQTLREMYEIPYGKYKHTVSEHLEMNEKRFPELIKSGITSNTPRVPVSTDFEEDENIDKYIDETDRLESDEMTALNDSKQEGSIILIVIICFLCFCVLIFFLWYVLWKRRFAYSLVNTKDD